MDVSVCVYAYLATIDISVAIDDDASGVAGRVVCVHIEQAHAPQAPCRLLPPLTSRMRVQPASLIH